MPDISVDHRKTPPLITNLSRCARLCLPWSDGVNRERRDSHDTGMFSFGRGRRQYIEAVDMLQADLTKTSASADNADACHPLDRDLWKPA